MSNRDLINRLRDAASYAINHDILHEAACALAAMEWQDISTAKLDGKEVWLGWNPFPTSTVMPRRGSWDCGSEQWIVHWEDRGHKNGLTPIPFDPQPDYFCTGFIPTPPEIKP